MTPDPEPGFSRRKLTRMLVRLLAFMVVAMLASGLLHLLGLGPYLNTWWGTMLFVLALYVPLFRFMTVDTFTPSRMGSPVARGQQTQSQQAQSQARAERRRERNRYAGVRKSPRVVDAARGRP